ncbi:MAG: undecaprenyl-phosphate glucose phosphotransferase [Paramuribaculum sp.]|nr:undecaprenyl-phosphate glucose phosphotransferase [Paramuribaculum sp.]
MTEINQKGRYGKYIQLILTLVDILVLNGVFVITALLTPQFVSVRSRTVWLLANAAYIVALYSIKHMRVLRTIAMEHVVANSFRCIAIHAMLFVCCLYFIGIGTIGWKSFALFYGLLAVCLSLWWTLARMLIKFFRRRGRNYSTVVIVGINATSQRLYQVLNSDVGFGFHIAGFFDDDSSDMIDPELYRGKISELDNYMMANGVDEVYCVLPGKNEEQIKKVLDVTEQHVARYFYVPQFTRFVSRNYEMYALGSIPVLSVRHQPLSLLGNRLIKRAFDVMFSSVVLLFSPIVFIPVAIAIKISSPGPVFFKQKRTGYRGREFDCYKFRTMMVNADSDRVQASKNDARKTRVGNFLRKTSIDELPQFLNVLKGDMSVVGPRPHMLVHTKEYSSLIKKYMVRHYIKPGITGWAQINGYRGQTEQLWQMEKRVEYDVWYIEHWSPLLDIKIIFRTVYNAIHGESNAF